MKTAELRTLAKVGSVSNARPVAKETRGPSLTFLSLDVTRMETGEDLDIKRTEAG
jgi:hypothetical protein